jgi:putative salt-induced outer membrane protein YdiY
MKTRILKLCRQNMQTKVPTLAALILLAAGTIAVAADTTQTNLPAPPPPKWDSSITLGATLTRGNSKTYMASGIANTKRTWTNDEALFGASAGYGESTINVNGNSVDTTTASYVKGYGQWNHLFTPKVYGGLRLTGEHDDIAALTYRFTTGPQLGYYFIKESEGSLSAEIGPSYTWEKFFSQPEVDYVSLRLAERGERKFATGAKIWESVEWLPRVEDFSNYIVNAEAGVSAPISKALCVSLIMQDTYQSVPAMDKLKNDFKLIAGLTYTF